MADQRDEVIKFVTLNGPILPVQLAKYLNTNILFASAMLSELVENKKLKISHASIGGSPLYYISGQEAKLDNRLAESIGGREKQAYELIRDNKILREKDLEPWQRVAIKSLKDFAASISVIAKENNEVFWKYHLVNDEEAKQIITETISSLYPEETEKQETNVANSPQTVQTIERIEEKIQEPPKIEVTEEKQEENVTQQELVKEVVKSLREELLKDIKPKHLNQEKIPRQETKDEIKEIKKPDGKFYEKVSSLLKENEAEIIKEEMIKKDKEIDFIVNINTKLGKLRYYVKAKNKASINESDISMAFAEGQLKKLPTILVVNGKINKKAINLVNTKLQGQLMIKEI
ncbi:MAG TPA: hypothetical protein VJG30_01360 [Candidatus Nanoarchaeia archaeon]|nr:hypothetical protein [Candidatus Nanoarchaeia archaeon]